MTVYETPKRTLSQRLIGGGSDTDKKIISDGMANMIDTPARTPALAVPDCSPLSYRSRITEVLPFTHRLACKILIGTGFMA